MPIRRSAAIPVALVFALAPCHATATESIQGESTAPTANPAAWPFDAQEARKRQDDAAAALGKPKATALDLGGGVAIRFILIPAGIYRTDAQKEVSIGRPFYLGLFKVTQAQYVHVMGKNPSAHAGPENPVDSVSWANASAFCAKILAKTRKPVRLPSEAEWESACRAGTATRCYWGDDMANLNDYCWWHNNCGGTTHPVGLKKPNAYGLYDMMGLLWEWCSDGGPEAAQHTSRGATWGSKEGMFKSSVRFTGADDSIHLLDRFGFRVAMDAE